MLLRWKPVLLRWKAVLLRCGVNLVNHLEICACIVGGFIHVSRPIVFWIILWISFIKIGGPLKIF